MNEYHPDCQVEFFDLLMRIYDEMEYSPELIFWSVEATSKLNGPVAAGRSHT
jgi:hypothetical protein